MPAPVISILTPVYNPPVEALRAAIGSVRSQDYPHWELILVNDCSPSPAVATTLRELAALDKRIVVHTRSENGGIVAASSDALRLATGEFVALLDHDDMLARGALAAVAEALIEQPDADYLYTDEDKISDQGDFFDAFDKPEWSPERLLGQMYTGHLSVLRTSLVRDVGGFVVGTDGSQDHDLVLRVTEQARSIVHLPEVYYHWRAIEGSTAHDSEAKPYAWMAGLQAVQRSLERRGIRGRAELGPQPGTYRVVREIDPDLTVSIVIPTRGGNALVWGETRCLVVELVRSLVTVSTHQNLEIVIVYDEPTPASVLAELRAIAGDRVVLVPFLEPFNFSAKCNVGYLASSGEVVVFLNDDMQLVSPNFAAELAAPLFEEGVGATGARLLFSDGSLQHGGHVYASGDLTHAGFKGGGDEEGPFRAFLVSRECSGLTAACIAVTRDTFERVGGFNEGLPGNFNDVDFSRKIGSLDLRLLWMSDVTLYHFESLTRDSTVHQWEYDTIMRRWGTPERDPYFPVGFRAEF
ncbi:glycosyltransferase family 2 protein [Cellulomonas humilata]|uniref:Glycosyltransferase involved in cell wall biosynthesis n=1 Tax=Cellulomonas humilata TaxID=144055 RepID=A0ABU0EDU8_9CELL|nr:glycosyltransferase [Cellulomonas humilata]MDQ0373236.1 glycosyltransferase involved in cell wall biosynthesis [Cellulomonas humilata]